MNNDSVFKEIKKEDNLSKKEIESVINKIIDKNKSKITSQHDDNENFEYINKSLDKSAKLFYIKEKEKSKKEKKDFFSGKIINEARENLGKEPINKEEDMESQEETFNDCEKSKKKLKIRFGKKKPNEFNDKDFFTDDVILNKTENVVKGEGYDKVVDEIEKEIDSIDLDKFSIKNRKEELKEFKDQEDFIDEKELEKAIDFKTKSDKESIEETIDKGSLLEIREKKKEIMDNYHKHENSQDILEIQDENQVDKKIDQKKEIDNDLIPPPPAINKPKFKVENIPKSEEKELEEKKLIEEKLNNPEDEEKKEEYKLEKQAKTIVKQHITNKDSATIPKEYRNKEKDSVIAISLNIDSDEEHEHMFFDEDVRFNGWSPHTQEKEKLNEKKISELHEELKNEELGEVKNIELPKEALTVESVKLSDLGFSENEWEELDFYPLHEPFAYVEVLREKETLEKRYFLVEVELNDEENKILDFIKETIFHLNIETEDMEFRGEDEYLAKQINSIIKEYNLRLNKESFEKILYYFSKESLGFGKIDPLMKDPNIEDISCDGSGIAVFLYHRKYGSLKSNIKFPTEDDLSGFVFKLAQKCGKHISIAEPMVDATMPDGSRIQMTLSDEITAHGSTFTIRKFRSDPFSPPDLVEFNTMNSEIIAYMWLSIENGINMLFAGGTASGKTSTLNALSLFIPPESKIVSIEETREINLPHPNWIPGVARSGFGEAIADKTIGQIDMYDLMKAALRQRPEYIIVGEIRGREAYVLFQAMATGHATYSTVHADSAQSLIHRLEGKPINIPRVMLQSLDVVSLHIITKVNNKRARRCKQVIEIIDIDPTTKEILTNEVFRWDPVEDKFVYSGKSYILERIRAEKDYSRDQITNELQSRMKLIEHMNNANIREFREVANLVSKYNESPEETLKKFK